MTDSGLPDEYHVPTLAVRELERVLGVLIGRQLCMGCGQPLGNEPRVHLSKLMYHPRCAPEYES